MFQYITEYDSEYEYMYLYLYKITISCNMVSNSFNA